MNKPNTPHNDAWMAVDFVTDVLVSSGAISRERAFQVRDVWRTLEFGDADMPYLSYKSPPPSLEGVVPDSKCSIDECEAHGLAHPCEACAVESQYEEVIADHNRLVRELDVLLNGEAAAKQASLCDIVSQVQREGIRSCYAQVAAMPLQQRPDER